MATGFTTDFPPSLQAELAAAASASSVAVPPLEQGDHLTRAEFERRYEAMTEVKKAELIEGVVYMPSPVRAKQHGEPHSNLGGWLFRYKCQTPGLISPDNATLRLDQDNEPQPDSILMIEPNCGGQAAISADGYIEGAPELVAEIVSSSVSADMHTKLHIYRRNGVLEYVVWRVLDRGLNWFKLHDGEYVLLSPDNQGVIRSEVFPGLWLNVPAMLESKLDIVLDTLQQGMATPEHKAFVAQLASRKKS
jgi:Uma2 family endonuclease